MSEVSEVQVPQLKKYVLIDAVKSSAKIFVKTGEGAQDGIRLDTPRKVKLYLKHIFTDKTGKQQRTRFKMGANSIHLDPQIKLDNIPANEKFTDNDRRHLYFINGVLVTDNEFVQSFLHEDNNPQRADFTGRDRGNVTALFKELDEVAIVNDEHSLIRDTATAISKIFTMNLDEVKGLLSVFYGASYNSPNEVKEAQNIAAKALENNPERLRMVNEGSFGSDDKIVILLGKAINAGVISFDNKADYVQMKRNGEWVDVKLVAGDTYEIREVAFRQHLSTAEGELLRKDIETATSTPEKETKAKTPKTK